MLKAIHAQEDKAAANEKAKAVEAKLRKMKLKKAADIVHNGIAETLTYMDYPTEHWIANVKHFFTPLGKEFFLYTVSTFLHCSVTRFLHRKVRSFLHCLVRSFLLLCQVADEAGRYFVN